MWVGKGDAPPMLDGLTDASCSALTFQDLVTGYLEDYELHGYRAIKSARSRVAQLRRAFGALTADAITSARIRAYQLERRRAGAATGTINRETSALSRMF